jgi:hypothetical protein
LVSFFTSVHNIGLNLELVFGGWLDNWWPEMCAQKRKKIMLRGEPQTDAKRGQIGKPLPWLFA